MRSNLRRVEKIIRKPFEKWKVGDFKNDEKILDDFIDLYQLNSVIVSLNAIKMWLMFQKAKGSIIEDYGDIIKDLGKTKDDQVHKQEKTDIEEDLGDDFEWPIMQAKIRKYVSQNIDKVKGVKLKQLVMVSLFGLQPSTRIGNYLGMVVKDGEGGKLSSNKNYLIVPTKRNDSYKFIFNKYKTSKHIGKTELKVVDKLLSQVLDKYTDTLDGEDPLLFDMTQAQITNNLKSITKKIFGVGFSVNVFRHSFLTNFLSGNPSIEEKSKMAKVIGQTYKPSRGESYVRID